jgi:hypothetical protein
MECGARRLGDTQIFVWAIRQVYSVEGADAVIQSTESRRTPGMTARR